jgi:predicted outer membrane protein
VIPLSYSSLIQTENEALRQELAKQKQDYAAQLAISKQFNQQVQDLRSQLETECASREEIEAELSELKQNSAPAATLPKKLTPDAATILSQLRARRKKSKTDLADLEAILEILES